MGTTQAAAAKRKERRKKKKKRLEPTRCVSHHSVLHALAIGSADVDDRAVPAHGVLVEDRVLGRRSCGRWRCATTRTASRARMPRRQEGGVVRVQVSFWIVSTREARPRQRPFPPGKTWDLRPPASRS